MTLYAPPAPYVPDGTFTYNRVNAFGPATATKVVIHDGALFDFALNGESTRVDRLHEVEAAVKTELAWHIHHGLATRTREVQEVAA